MSRYGPTFTFEERLYDIWDALFSRTRYQGDDRDTSTLGVIARLTALLTPIAVIFGGVLPAVDRVGGWRDPKPAAQGWTVRVGSTRVDGRCLGVDPAPNAFVLVTRVRFRNGDAYERPERRVECCDGRWVSDGPVRPLTPRELETSDVGFALVVVRSASPCALEGCATRDEHPIGMLGQELAGEAVMPKNRFPATE